MTLCLKNYFTDDVYKMDKKRYLGKMPIYQKFFRKTQISKSILKKLYKLLFTMSKKFYHVEIGTSTDIGPGLYIGHPYCITINPNVKIGNNCNIHKGVTIGQENRGLKKGTPVIGNEVWIGVNATIVGKITIGDDVMIAPNTFVNCDIPSHSIVFGNPCVIKHRENATEGYINRKI